MGVLAFGASRNLSLILLTASPLLDRATLQSGATNEIALADRFTLTFRVSPLAMLGARRTLHRQPSWWFTFPLVQIPLPMERLAKFIGATMGTPLSVSRLLTESALLVPLLPVTMLVTLLKRLMRERETTMVPIGNPLRPPLTSRTVVRSYLMSTSVLKMT